MPGSPTDCVVFGEVSALLVQMHSSSDRNNYHRMVQICVECLQLSDIIGVTCCKLPIVQTASIAVLMFPLSLTALLMGVLRVWLDGQQLLVR